MQAEIKPGLNLMLSSKLISLNFLKTRLFYSQVVDDRWIRHICFSTVWAFLPPLPLLLKMFFSLTQFLFLLSASFFFLIKGCSFAAFPHCGAFPTVIYILSVSLIWISIQWSTSNSANTVWVGVTSLAARKHGCSRGFAFNILTPSVTTCWIYNGKSQAKVKESMTACAVPPALQSLFSSLGIICFLNTKFLNIRS